LNIKLEKLSSGDDTKHVTEEFTKNFESIIQGSNKDLDKINKYLGEVYVEIMKKEGGSKDVLAKIMKVIKETITRVSKLAKNGKVSDFDVFTFTFKNIPVMLIVGKNDGLVNKSVDHTSFKFDGSKFMTIFDNKSRNPLRVELNGIAYPIILTNKTGYKEVQTSKDLEGILLTCVNDIKTSLNTPNSFSGFKTSGLTAIVDMVVERKTKAVEFVGTQTLKDGLKNLNIKNEDVFVSLAMEGILLIGINTLLESKLLGYIIKNEKNESIRKKIIKKLFGQA